jgi:hypothetical protein
MENELMSKLQKAMIALTAAAAIGVIAPQAASAHGAGHGGGGGFHGGGGGFHGGFGGFHGGGGWGSYRGFRHGYGFGPGFGLGAYYYDGGYPYYDYPYEDSYYPGQCMIIHHRVHTRHGWRYRIIHICE